MVSVSLFTTTQDQNRKRIKLLLVLFLAIGFLIQEGQSQADEIFTANSTDTPEFPSHLWNQHTRSTELNLIPTRLMTDEQLILSARYIRQSACSQSQRLLNNVWLTMEQSKQYEGARALGKVLTLGYFSYRRALTPEEISNPLMPISTTLNEDSVITHFENYDLEFSARSVKFSFHLAL
jgi:hypothetical protein